MPHTRRPAVSRHRPLHITVRVTRATWNLRTQRCFNFVRGALEAVKTERGGFRVVHFSVQHDHIHLIIEAADRRSLSGGMKALLIRIARGLNRLMGSPGKRFDDRYHEHVLKTPSETRNALLYVIGNRAVHLGRWGKSPAKDVDVFSSLAAEELIRPPGSWLLREGWLRAPPA